MSSGRRRELDRVKPYQLFDLMAGTSTGGFLSMVKHVEEC